jgi:hypothetical protein
LVGDEGDFLFQIILVRINHTASSDIMYLNN